MSKKAIADNLTKAANTGVISPATSDMVIANLESTILPAVMGGDLISTPWPAVVKWVIDVSGSMSGRATELINALNQSRDELANDELTTGTEYHVSVTFFNDQTQTLIPYPGKVADIPSFSHSNVRPSGLTDLFGATYDGITEAIAYGISLWGLGATGNQQMVVVITDGFDNINRRTAAEVARLVKEASGAANFIIAFIGIGERTDFEPIALSMGIPKDNIMTDKDIHRAITRASNSVKARSQRASQGLGQSPDFFVIS